MKNLSILVVGYLNFHIIGAGLISPPYNPLPISPSEEKKERLSSHSVAVRDDDNYYSWWDCRKLLHWTEQEDFTSNFLINQFIGDFRNWRTTY